MKTLDKEILRLALPSILANITIPLVGMVDMAVAGHLDGGSAALIGGISVGSLMFDLLYWNFGFLRAGTGGLTAQAFGRGDIAGCRTNLRRSLLTALALSLVLIAIQWPFEKLIFFFVNCSEEVRHLATRYFRLRIWAAPATLSLMVLRGWFIGMQDTFSSMLTDLVVNGTNIILSIFLATGLPRAGFSGLGYIGIAWGTVAAQYGGLAFACAMIFRRFGKVMAAAPAEGEPEGSVMENFRRFYKVNADLFIRSLCLMAVYLAFTAISARFGDVLLATCSIMMKLMLVFSYFTDGFAFAGEALTGKFTGMQDTAMVRHTVRHTFAWSMGIGLLFVLVYAFFGIPMFRLMTTDHEVLESARQFIPWLAFIPLLGCPAFTWDGIYTGATATRQMRDSNIGCVFAFAAVWLAGSALLRPEGAAGVHLLFAAYYAHLVFRSVYQTVKYRSAILLPVEGGIGNIH